MDLLSLALALALPAPPPAAEIDIDAPMKAARVELGSPWLRDMMTAAMATPYKYGVTQMPCKARVHHGQLEFTERALPSVRAWQPTLFHRSRATA